MRPCSLYVLVNWLGSHGYTIWKIQSCNLGGVVMWLNSYGHVTCLIQSCDLDDVVMWFWCIVMWHACDNAVTFLWMHHWCVKGPLSRFWFGLKWKKTLQNTHGWYLNSFEILWNTLITNKQPQPNYQFLVFSCVYLKKPKWAKRCTIEWLLMKIVTCVICPKIKLIQINSPFPEISLEKNVIFFTTSYYIIRGTLLRRNHTLE